MRYYPRCHSFKAVDNLLPRGYVQNVFPRLRLPPDVNVFYDVRDDLTAEDHAVLEKAGVTQVQPGIESLVTSTLRLIGKGTTAFRNLQFLKNCVGSAMHPVWNLLVGFPGEGEQVYRKYLRDIPLLVHLPPPSGAFPVRFDRYSPYFTGADRYGLDLRACDFYELVYPFPEEALSNLAYCFSDVHFEAGYQQAMLRWLAPLREQVGRWRAGWAGTAPRPLLRFDGAERTKVFDSRSGEALVHDVGEEGRRVLDQLLTPRTLDALAAGLADIKGFDAEKSVECLKERGLVFQEGERFLGLVLPAGRGESDEPVPEVAREAAGLPGIKRQQRAARQVQRDSLRK
jgi:magnesium-protoporphyrin IX monomethyl ester (oxidative) cyclase